MMRPQLLTLMLSEGRLINAVFFSTPADLEAKRECAAHALTKRVENLRLPLVLATELEDSGLEQLRAMFADEGHAGRLEALAGDNFLIFVTKPCGSEIVLNLH